MTLRLPDRERLDEVDAVIADAAAIALVRHGPSAAALPRGRLSREGLLAWRASYEAAGLAPGAAPPPALVQLAAGGRVVASDLPRAQESARLLAGTRTFECSALLREAHLAIPAWFPTRLPTLAWAALIHLEWAWSILRGRDVLPDEQTRARAAAAWLSDRAAPGHPLVAVTHGVMRRLVARELERAGWTPAPGLRRYQCWSAWVLTRR